MYSIEIVDVVIVVVVVDYGVMSLSLIHARREWARNIRNNIISFAVTVKLIESQYRIAYT